MREKYNLKIKEYNSQITVSLYNHPVIIRDELENAIIQLKRFRCANIDHIIDLGDGNSEYTCDGTLLDSKINDVITEMNLQAYCSYIKHCVPCTYIAETIDDYKKHERSIISSLNRTKKTIYDYAYANEWDMFVTLTFDDNILLNKYGKNASDYDTCVKCLHSFFTVLKRQSSEIQYLGVPELHHYYYDNNNNAVLFRGQKLSQETYITILNKSKRSMQEQSIIDKVLVGEYKRRFHFHFLINNYPEKFLTDSFHRDRKGRIIYNLTNYKLGFTTATIIDSVEASQHYITKYISKDLVELSKGRKRYWISRNLNKPKENLYYLDEKEFKDINNDIINTIESDTRYKIVSVENGLFKNTIYNGIVLENELFKTDYLIDYIDLGVVRHFHYKTFNFDYDENDKNNLHFTHPSFNISYLCCGRCIPNRSLDYLVKPIIDKINEEFLLYTARTAFGAVSPKCVLDSIMYFTIDGVFCKAVLENGKYVYHKL